MLTKTKIALAAVLFAGSASVALAQDADPNLLNRYPGYNGTATAPQGTFQSAPVGLRDGGTIDQVQTRRSQVQTFHFDSAPLVSGGGY
ncbi:MAG: hypothetical protein QOG38_717 [Hyphomicrobiales bacterium]|jgi:hypothetical protein|nr:hypothetical protein [Hyphomicrobiales bacterium]